MEIDFSKYNTLLSNLKVMLEDVVDPDKEEDCSCDDDCDCKECQEKRDKNEKDECMEDKFWMQKAFANSHGQLRKKAGLSKNSEKNIPAKKLNQLAKSSNIRTKRQATLAKTARKIANKNK